MRGTGDKGRVKYDPENHWSENPDYPVEDWQYEVANNETRLGYHEWVENQQEMESV